jgi:uridine kinase
VNTVGHRIRIDDNQPIIIEGIHGLNEELTVMIPKRNKYKIYISALTQLNIDDHNRIPTTDGRLIRRIVRDYQFRGASIEDTLSMWPSVRRGEEAIYFSPTRNRLILCLIQHWFMNWQC